LRLVKRTTASCTSTAKSTPTSKGGSIDTPWKRQQEVSMKFVHSFNFILIIFVVIVDNVLTTRIVNSISEKLCFVRNSNGDAITSISFLEMNVFCMDYTSSRKLTLSVWNQLGFHKRKLACRNLGNKVCLQEVFFAFYKLLPVYD
jgi:hypothetical protein